MFTQWHVCLCEPSPAQTPSVFRSLAEAAERLELDLLAGLALQDGWTPLYTACLKGHSEVVGRLIAARAMVDVADKVLPPPILLFSQLSLL